MLYAALAQCPVIGGKPVSFDPGTAMTLPGVKKVVQISDGVAVVADTWWHARKGLEQVQIKWDEGAGRHLDTAGHPQGPAGLHHQAGRDHQEARRCGRRP